MKGAAAARAVSLPLPDSRDHESAAHIMTALVLTGRRAAGCRQAGRCSAWTVRRALCRLARSLHVVRASVQDGTSFGAPESRPDGRSPKYVRARVRPSLLPSRNQARDPSQFLLSGSAWLARRPTPSARPSRRWREHATRPPLRTTEGNERRIAAPGCSRPFRARGSPGHATRPRRRSGASTRKRTVRARPSPLRASRRARRSGGSAVRRRTGRRPSPSAPRRPCR